MRRAVFLTVLFVIIGWLVFPAPADEPKDKQQEAKTYTVTCKLVRKLWTTESDDKKILHKLEEKIPDVTTLEGTRAEYHSGGKLGSTPYGFRLQIEVKRVTDTKVRVEVFAEDSSAEGGWQSLTRANSQRVVRQIALGKTIKLMLAEPSNGETVWVELSVREAAEE
jgi:hypothetical protein